MLKRVFDLVIAASSLALLTPILAVIAVAVYWSLGAPVLFRQARPGLRARIFSIYKFRTMRDAVDRFGKPLPDGARLSRFGRFLRATSLDELPELWNVLVGDMS